MKIGGSPGASKIFNTSPVAISYRTGDVVVVSATKVLSLGEDHKEALLKFPDGNDLTTILNGKFPLKEGEIFSIKIQKSENNTIYATVVDRDAVTYPQSNTERLLGNINIPITEDNLSAAAQMLRYGLDRTCQNLHLLIEYKRKYPSTTLEQIAFMLKNKLPINRHTVAVLYSLLYRAGLIGEELFFLLRKLRNRNEDEQLRELIKDFFKNPGSGQFEAGELRQNHIKSDLLNILSYIINKRSLGKESPEEARKLAENEKNKSSLLMGLRAFDYCQIPVCINGSYSTAEIFHKKESKDKKDGLSAVLHLKIPTSRLGLVQLFLDIDENKKMQCHIAAENNLDFIKQSILTLSDMLNDIGYHLVKVTYNQIPADINILNFEVYVELIVNRRGYDERV